MEDYKIFEPVFNFEEYIEKRLRDISDLNERKLAKTVLIDCLLKGIEQSEQNYKKLEDRIYHEVENEEKKYAVYMTAIKRDDYDEIDPCFFPVCPEDLQKPSIDMLALCEALETKKSYPLFSAYLEEERSVCQKLEREKRIFQGKLFTNQDEYLVEFQLQKNPKYNQVIENLYHLFLDNGVPWTTINCGYLDKFFLIELVRSEKIPSQDEKFQSIQIEFEELGQSVQYDTLPVWNIETILYNSADFVMPCVNSIHFEHEFPIRSYGLENGFLIESKDEIVEIRREEGKICIITPVETFDKWKAYKVVSKIEKMPLGYNNELLHNVKKDSFTKRYIDKLGVQLQTRAEITRRIHEFNMEKYVRFLGVELVNGAGPEGQILGEMNWFIQDELLDQEGKKTLLLKFQAQESKSYFTEDTINFLISELQRHFGEYRCSGILINKE